MPIDHRPSDPRSEWQNQPTEDFRMSHALLQRHVASSHRRLRWLSAAQYTGACVSIVCWVLIAVTFDDHIIRVGAVMAALLFVFVLVLLYRAPRGRDDGSAIAVPFIESYRADLERHRTLFSGYRLWVRPALGIPVATVFCLGVARSYPVLAPQLYLVLGATVAGLSISTVVAHRKAQQYQQEIEELDALRR